MSHNKIPVFDDESAFDESAYHMPYDPIDFHVEESDEFINPYLNPYPLPSLVDSHYGSDNRFPLLVDSRLSGDEPWNQNISAPVAALGHSKDSTSSKDSGYGSVPSSRKSGDGRSHSESAASSTYTPATVRSVRPKKTVEAGYLYCLHGNCKYQTRRQHAMDRHERTHTPLTPEERLNCPARGCGRTGDHGFYRKDHLDEHLRRVHPKDIPPGDIGRYNANLEAPSERLRSLSSQSPYVAEKSPDTASGIEKSVSHDMGEVDKESPSSTDLKSVRDVHVAPEPKLTHGKSISQSVKPGYEHNGLNPNAKTFIPGEPIETAKDINRHQKSLELPEAIMDLGDTGMPRSSIHPEKRISDLTHPVGLSENMAKVKDAAQMNTSGSLVEAVDDQPPHLPHDAQANTKPVRIAPQYDAYVMTLLSLRIELRVWLGRRAPSPTMHISTNGERPLEDGKQRIRWTCRCDRRLYDDFEELRPGALEELEQMLNEQNRIPSPEGNGSGQHRGSSIRALWNAAGGIIGSLTSSRPLRNNNLPTLPMHQNHAAGQERNSQSSATSENLFLLMCIPYRKHGTRLVHMDLAELASDETLLRKLRHEYQSVRGQWTSYLSLWKMVEIQFVKFGLHKNQLIDIQEKNDLPPESLKDEYRYQPIPAETIPPIGTNHLMHLYEHPDHADDVPFCLERIPKKIREQLKLSPHQAPGLLGWGVYFAEGFNWPKFWVFGSVILSLSVLFGVCWSTLRQDIQGGFGVTACMMVAVTFTTGVVQAAVEQT